MTNAWELFRRAARREAVEQVPVALIVDSPWLPGYAGIDTRDYFVLLEKWFEINRGLCERFPDVAWIPGYWIEYGMAAEPSAFGVKLQFHADSPPSIEPLVDDLAFWEERIKPADPHTDGLMPLVLRLYAAAEERLQAEGLGIQMVCARGPLAVASWLAGISPLMMDMALNPDRVTKILDVVTETIIRWLQAQLETLHVPEGIMVLDDLVGMVSPKQYKAMVEPHMQRIFDAFDGLIRVYHNDTPCEHLLEHLADAHFDVFNFSHKTDIGAAKTQIGDRVALLGNVPPLDVGVRGTPDEVFAAATACLESTAGVDPSLSGVILSFGGGVSPGTPPENIDALRQAAQAWTIQS